MKGVFYDTNLFSYFFLTKDFDHPYSPTNKDFLPYISLFVEEEFLHVVLKGSYKNWGINKKFLDIWKELQTFLGLFREANTSISTIKVVLFDLIGILNQTLNLELLYRRRKMPDIMDLLHLSASDIVECELFLTTDKKFEILGSQNVKNKLMFKSVKKILIFDIDNPSKLLKEVDIQ